MKTCTFNLLEYKLVPIELLNAVEHLLKCKGRFHTEQNFNALKSAHFNYSTMPEYPADASWVSVDERLPEIGCVVDLCIDGIVQNETYELDAIDSSYSSETLRHFWSRNGSGNGIMVESGQYWLDRPRPPEPEAK